MWMIRDYRVRYVFERKKRNISSVSSFFRMNNNVDWMDKLYDDCGEMRADLIRSLETGNKTPVEFKPWWEE